MRMSGLSLKQRLLLVVLLPAALLAGAIAGLFIVRGTQAADDAMRERGMAIVSFLAPAAEYGVISGNRNTLIALLQAVLEQRDVAAVAVYDNTGDLMAVSGRPLRASPSRIVTTRSAQILEEHALRISLAAPVLAAPLPIHDLPDGFFSSIEQAAPEIGWVYVELDTQALAQHKRVILATTLALTLGGLGLTALLAVRLAHSVSAPVAELAGAVSKIAAGQLDTAVPDNATIGELRALQGGFNAMARSIAEVHDTLQTKVDEATAQLAHQALHDPLTGLPNRRAFEQALEDTVAASRRAGDQGALCFIDLDRFKIVNDTCGHAAGDELLRRIARLIRQRVRGDDLLCRIGGDEFALILRGCGVEEALGIAESLRESVSAFRFNWEDRRFSVGASVGLVRIDGGMDSASDVLVAADLACYAAKKAGRNRVVEHEHVSPPEHADKVPQIERTPTDTIPYARLRLMAQPIMPLRPGAGPAWREVLLRLQGDNGDLLTPGDFLTRLESGSAGLALDLWVAEQACALIGRHAAETGQPIAPFGLNLTRGSVQHATQYIEVLTTHLRQRAIEAERVVLEFPAALAEQCPEEAATLARLARKLGCRIALERLDGGAMNLLRSLRPDYVKVSLKTLAESYGLEAGCNLAQAVCAMAGALAIPAVASEVEDELFREALTDYGFDFAQGSSIAAPTPLNGS